MRDSVLILTGIVELMSPTLIGSGESEKSKMDVLLDSKNRPFIPASSLMGVLRHYLQSSAMNQSLLNNFWGFSDENDGRQSKISCSDLILVDGQTYNIQSREGICIDEKNGITKEGALYDYQLIEPGPEFKLYIEVSLVQDEGQNSRDFSRKMLATISRVLSDRCIRIGAMTNSGFGEISLSKYKIYEIDFKKKEHIKAWLRRDFSQIPAINNELASFEIDKNEFSISAAFVLKNSFISRLVLAKNDEPDSKSITSKKHYIIPGTSIKGALRKRALRIIKTIGRSQPEEFINNLFGFVETQDTDFLNNSQKGKIHVEEIQLKNYYPEIQHRIKIDRFTGGTVKGALFNSMPLFVGENNNNNEFELNLKIMDYTSPEAGLLLLLLKDLWTGDLSIGGEKSVGRGCLLGKKAIIQWNDNKIEIKENINELGNVDREKLDNFVRSLYSEENVAEK
ncbi:MAG: RAMP superfamily CRISPR-associated protein [Elusimicrobiota bacterium]